MKPASPQSIETGYRDNPTKIVKTQDALNYFFPIPDMQIKQLIIANKDDNTNIMK